MSGILDSMIAKPRAFFPQSVAEYTALQLARKLGDTDRLSTYVSMFEHRDPQMILEAFAGARATGLAGEELIRAFEESLAALTSYEDDEF